MKFSCYFIVTKSLSSESLDKLMIGSCTWSFHSRTAIKLREGMLDVLRLEHRGGWHLHLDFTRWTSLGGSGVPGPFGPQETVPAALLERASVYFMLCLHTK